MATKKVGSTGRFGVRYGVTLKQKLKPIEEKQRMKYDCPSCSKVSVKRVAKGIWSCTKCHHTFAAKAYGIGE